MHRLVRNLMLLAVVLCSLGETWADPSWVQGDGCRSLQVVPKGAKPGFTLMAPSQTGVWFTNQLQGDAYLTNAVAHNGAGVALGDVDGDGRVDIYLCSLQGRNRLYRNLGNWQFEEMDAGGAACAGQFSTGAVFADVDGDGTLDLLVNGIAAGTRLFLNDGKGHFTESAHSGLSRTASGTSMALADIDGDGDLDLYCTHYIDVMHLADPTMRFGLARRGDQWEVIKVNGESARSPKWKGRFEALPDGRVRELPEVHGFYRNDGKGHFIPIQDEPGVFMDAQGKPIPPYRDWGLSVMFRDLNGDGFPDFYVCNDSASPDRLWINTGKGTFRAADYTVLRHTSRSSMAIDFADVDRDGHDDFIVLDMLARDHARRMTQLARDYPDPQLADLPAEQPRYNRNTLNFGRADGSFVDAAFMAGVAATDWSWCPLFLDVDLDGYEDLLVSNGFSFDVMDQDSEEQFRKMKIPDAQLKRARQLRPRWPTPNAAFRNRRDGTFEPMEHAWGFDHVGVSYGMAMADLDNDGDLDVVVNNLNECVSLYRNDATAGRIAVRLKGLPPNTQGIGARLQLSGGPVTQSQEMICGGRYLSCDQAIRVFASGPDLAKAQRLEVTWRSGELSALDVLPNRTYEVDQASAQPRPSQPTAPPVLPYFKEVSSLLNHRHVDDAMDDWARQPMLPRRLSRLAPGLAWFDWDGDGWEDLIVTGGQGGKLAIYLNQKGQGFRLADKIAPTTLAQGAVVGWPDGAGRPAALVAVSNYGLAGGQQSALVSYALTNRAAPQLWPQEAALGPLAVADIDGDGALDLFVGGRFLPGRYPEAASSTIWLNQNGQLQLNRELSAPFESIGLVSGATFCDLDGDGAPDLALAMEWGPVRVFHNDHGRFKEITAALGLDQTSGWWTSITAGDFDGDGRMDLAVGNWGRNSFYELYRPGPLRIYYGDWNGDGILEMIEAWRSDNRWLPVRTRSWLERGWPELKQRFPTHELLSKASIEEILGEHAQQAKFVEASHFESAIFLNRGSHFECVPLPREAQLSPVFSINVGDVDGDGIEDLFLSQNFFGSASDISRDDAGRGLWLRGTGTGTFTALDSQVTGVKVLGEQRGAALADFNHDGRIDLAVSENNGPTRLYVNQRAKRGLRVSLQGPPVNPDGIGAQMRVLYSNGSSGPCRAIQEGSGYWSQDGAVPVLGLREAPQGLWIRWPGGHEQTVPFPGQTWELSVAFPHEQK